jgi:hypothetical protein
MFVDPVEEPGNTGGETPAENGQVGVQQVADTGHGGRQCPACRADRVQGPVGAAAHAVAEFVESDRPAAQPGRAIQGRRARGDGNGCPIELDRLTQQAEVVVQFRQLPESWGSVVQLAQLTTNS